MSRTLQEWSLEDVLSIFFGEEANFIVQAIRGESEENLPESIYENKATKEKIIVGFTQLAQNYYGGTFGDEFFPSTVLDVSLNPLIVTCWLRDEGIFDEMYFCISMPLVEAEKITNIKMSAAKDFDSIDLKEFARADYWSETEFFVLLFGEAYSDTFFPYMLREFPLSLDKNISTIKKFLIGASERGKLIAISSATPTLLPECYLFQDNYLFKENGIRFEPTQLLAVLDLKGFPIPDGLMEYINGGKFDEAEELLSELRKNMLCLLGSKDVFPDQPPQSQTKLEDIKDRPDVLDKNTWICKGEFWSIAWGGKQEINIKNSHGMKYIAHLLLNEDTEIYATQLETIDSMGPQEIQSAWENHELEIQYNEAPDEVMDEKYIKKLKQGLNELKDMKKEADISCDQEKMEDCDDNIEKIQKLLSSNTDLKGKSKKFKNRLESARLRVRNNINNALKKIKEHDSELVKYLMPTIKCEGKKFSYTPSHSDPIHWKVNIK